MSDDILGEDLFSAVVHEIRNYDGKDSLRPWVHGIKKMQEKLPPQVLREKLPRFLQKCIQTFQSDTRYHNDSRYVGVWIKLMDFVDEPKALLRMMEKSQIGTKRAAFYMAYSIYYEKKKQFEEADHMYHLGVKNLAEPVDELQKAYEQFLHRMELYKQIKQKLKETKAKMGMQLSNQPQGEKSLLEGHDHEITNAKRKNFPSDDTMVVKFTGAAIVGRWEAENVCHHGLVDQTISMEEAMNAISNMFREPLEFYSKVKETSYRINSAAKLLVSNNVEEFVDDAFKHQENGSCETSAIGGSSEGTNTCHNELMDPTINMKEVMNAISNMFREPVDLDFKSRKELSRSNYYKKQLSESNIEVFVNGAENQKNQKRETDKVACRSVIENVCHHGLVDPTVNMKEAIDAVNFMFREPIELDSKLKRKAHRSNSAMKQFPNSNLEVFADDEFIHLENHTREINTSRNENAIGSSNNCGFSSHCQSKKHIHQEKSNPSCEGFKILADDETQGFKDSQDDSASLGDVNFSRDVKSKDDTVITSFFDSQAIDGLEVENACHHGLVDPTINLKEAMDDINYMFGQPINFVRPRRTRREDKLPPEKSDSQGFSIFTDEDREEPCKDKRSLILSGRPDLKSDLFEPTVFTKEALDDINAMFGKPLDFS